MLSDILEKVYDFIDFHEVYKNHPGLIWTFFILLIIILALMITDPKGVYNDHRRLR